MSPPPKTPPLPQYADKPTPRRGAPEKLTPELQADFCKYLRIGARPAQCCGMVRITMSTFYQWLKQGAPGTDPSIYRDFNMAVAEAMSQHEVGALARLTSAATGRTERNAAGEVIAQIPPDPKWDAWMLEHVYSKRYNKQHMELTGADGAPIETINYAATDTSARLAALVARARARAELSNGQSSPGSTDDTGRTPGAKPDTK